MWAAKGAQVLRNPTPTTKIQLNRLRPQRPAAPGHCQAEWIASESAVRVDDHFRKLQLADASRRLSDLTIRAIGFMLHYLGVEL